MSVISASLIRKPKQDWRCDACRQWRGLSPKIRAYGYAHRGDRPYVMYLCRQCAEMSRGTKENAKITTVLDAL